MISTNKYKFSEEHELDFQKKYNENQIISVRVGLSISIISYALYALSDSLVVPSNDKALTFYRFTVICPILSLFLAFSFFKEYRKLGQKIYTIQMISLGCLHLILLSFLSPEDPGFNSYYGGLILIIGGLGVLGGLRLMQSITTSIIIFLGYQLIAIYAQDLLHTKQTAGIFIINNLFLLTAMTISSFTSYLLETYSRKDYFKTLHLNQALDALKKSEDKLKLTHQEQTEWSTLFTRFIRHELSNSIIGVSSSLQLIKKKSKTDLNSIYIERAEKSLRELRDLLKKASEASSIDDALSVIKLKRININELLSELVSQYNQDNLNTIVFNTESSLDVMGSSILLNQLFRNLLDNAVRHSSKGKPVRLFIESDQSIVIENEGDALPEEFEKLIELGYSNTTVKSGSFGLGLYVVKKVMSEHGGTILAESLRTTSGARFKLTFP